MHGCSFAWICIDGEWAWGIDWRERWRADLQFWNTWRSGEMRGFHVVFEVIAHDAGELAFWSAGGCVIRLNGTLMLDDRDTHSLRRKGITVRANDRLTIAQWHLDGDLLWAAAVRKPVDDPHALLGAYLPRVQERLGKPTGPALKLFVSGQTPLRSIVSIYSMVLNGYAPARTIVYGEHQWSPRARELFCALLPFAEVIPTRDLEWRLEELGGQSLVACAHQHWTAMKISATVLTDPDEYCAMDDDVYILDSCADAVARLEDHELVFSQDADYGERYRALWGFTFGISGRMRAGRVNTGLYWTRRRPSVEGLAATLLEVPIPLSSAWLWEQGFVAAAYDRAKVWPLPSQRYFYPYHDGLPDGVIGYPYDANPCLFASIHFGGLRNKPSDTVAILHANALLRCKSERAVAAALQIREGAAW